MIQVEQFVYIPLQVPQGLVHPHTLKDKILTVPVGHVLTHALLRDDSLTYPGLHATQSVAEFKHSSKHPASHA